MDIHDILEEERVHLNSGRSTWNSSCYDGVHGDDRGMLRVIPSPLGKIRPRIVNRIAMYTVGMHVLVVGQSVCDGTI